MSADDPIRTLKLRAPSQPLRLHELLVRACPGLAGDAFGRWSSSRAIRQGECVVRDLDAVVEPGAVVTVDVAIESLGAAVWPSLRAPDGRAFVLTVSAPFERGAIAWSAGGDDAASAAIELELCGEQDGLCELALRWPLASTPAVRAPGDTPEAREVADFLSACHVLARLASCGLCVIGDPFHGGIACSGGPAWRSGPLGSHADAGAWPDESFFVDAPHGSTRPAWRISDATARVLGRGHPWIRLDEETDDPAIFRPGARVDLVTRDGGRHGQALVEGAGRSGVLALSAGDVAGRVIAGPSATKDWSIEASVARAVERRAELIAGSAETDAFRLVHGEADGLPGLHVDRLGPLLRVLVTARCALPLVDRVLVALGSAGSAVLPDPWRIVEVVHLDERVPGRFERVRIHGYSADPEGTAKLGREATVREHGLVYTVSPGLAEPERSAPGFGLFLDQRENRAAFVEPLRAAGEAGRGGRFLNLFAHTGAFSVALLAAGATEVVSVDLSAAVLRRLEANLAANAGAGVDASRHVSVCQDGRRYLEQLDAGERFDGIVLDPPTAAAAGRRFFSVRKDAVPMLALCLAHLAPQGRLLVTLNDRKARRRLAAAIEEAAGSVGVALSAVEPARASPDFPHLAGFDEGDPFAGFLVHVA